MSVKKSNDSINHIKELIELMLKTKTEYVKVGTIEVKLSQLALIEQSTELNRNVDGVNSSMNSGGEIPSTFTTDLDNDEDILFHSA